ncbi:hypothetical protein HYH03_017739 [Edaphochlamys debaryana]|uniref:Uncharacterized protein n=1 Tax=Edaphochlamys debaryana TaxID=47281 RepID=A0A836BP04_9CHLO|nr:hypothetical protein HYH03_017739 [Edaphochlamys debaryana]|eukprot:KAG2483387.1 hypothetical protein HYH03_017739 [Edaphochlamys debaryana]
MQRLVRVLIVLAALLPSLGAGRTIHSFLPRRSSREGGASKHLYCKLSGGCSQCQEHEEIERYCADTGFKELLRCTTNQKLAEDWPVVLTYPYPPDVHIADDEDQSEAKAKADAQGGSGSGPKMIRVVRSCTEKTVEQHQKALADEVAAADALYGGTGVGMVGGMGFGGRHMGLFNYELVMVVLLGLSLPVVYWRKIRIRHL